MKQLAEVKKLTGKQIRLGLFESVESYKITEDQIVVLIARAKVKPVRGGFEVTQRGSTLYSFRCNKLGAWIPEKPFTIWLTESPEWYSAYPGLTPEQHAQKAEWEELCHRPGNHLWPLDNQDRRRQGY